MTTKRDQVLQAIFANWPQASKHAVKRGELLEAYDQVTDPQPESKNGQAVQRK